MQPTTVRWLISCAAAFMAAGCHAPWSSPTAMDRSDPLPVSTAGQRSDVERTQPPTTAEKPQLPERIVGADRERVGTTVAKTEAPAANAEPDLRSLLAQLEQVGDVDPAAQQRLITELRGAKPELWPLVIEQFRSTLAYRERLNSKRAPREQSTADDQIATRPSSEIGRLVDPRALGRVPLLAPENAAEATLTNSEAPNSPAEFRSTEPASPINTAERARLAFDRAENTTSAEGRSFDRTSVAQASFESDGSAKLETSAALTPGSESPIAPPITPIGSIDSREADDWKALIEEAAANLKGRVAASPLSTAEVHQHVTLRMLRLLAGQTEAALEPIPGISPVEQDYWSRQFFALATYLDHHQQPEEKRRAAASVAHLDEAVAKLRELGSLSLRNLTFCKTVYDFGAYEPFPDEQFSPGEQVSIYVEVENFRSQSTEKGYRTMLGATYEIVDEQGERVAGGEFPDVADECRSRRRDFHVEYGLALPIKLTSGAYRLRLVVKDRESDKLGSAELAFDVEDAVAK